MYQLVQISKSSLLGFGLYQSYRNSRIFQAGWHEQKAFCTLDSISNLALLAIAATDNVTAVCGSKWAGRISKISYLSYALVPTLHYLSNHLEDSKVREVVDFVYLHLTDVVLVLSAVHSIAALWFGHNMIGNCVQLAFMTLTILEQGTFWMDPKQNQGILAKKYDGKIYSTYQPYVAQISYLVGVPFQFFYKGLIGKAIALATLFLRYAPLSYKAALIPSEVKESFQEAMERERSRAVELAPCKQGYPERQVTFANGFSLTKRHLMPVQIEDFFPEQTLVELEKELQEKLESDNKLTQEEKDILVGLFGKNGEAGQLRNVVIHSGYEALRVERTRVFKSIYGAIAQDWSKRSQSLLSRKSEFLCDIATANSMKNLYFEYYPILKYKDQAEAKESRAIGARLQSQISLIFQQYRDYGFAAGIQEWSKQLQEFVVTEGEVRAKAERERLYEEISDLSQIPTKLWWKNLATYCWKSIQGVLWNNFNYFLHHMGTNRHEVNFHMALYGEQLGLSDYEEARIDMEKLLQQFSLNLDLLDEASEHVGEFFKIQVLRLHQHIWYGNLRECILNPGDERIKSDDVLTYFNYRGPELALDTEDIDDYFWAPNEGQLNALIDKYLPQLLVDLDFIQEK